MMIDGMPCLRAVDGKRSLILLRLLAGGEHDLVQTLTDNDPDASIRRWGYKQFSDTGNQGSLFD